MRTGGPGGLCLHGGRWRWDSAEGADCGDWSWGPFFFSSTIWNAPIHLGWNKWKHHWCRLGWTTASGLTALLLVSSPGRQQCDDAHVDDGGGQYDDDGADAGRSTSPAWSSRTVAVTRWTTWRLVTGLYLYLHLHIIWIWNNSYLYFAGGRLEGEVRHPGASQQSLHPLLQDQARQGSPPNIPSCRGNLRWLGSWSSRSCLGGSSTCGGWMSEGVWRCRSWRTCGAKHKIVLHQTYCCYSKLCST